MDESELELLLALDGAVFEMAPGVVVEFAARRAPATRQRPHGISYALVLREKSGGLPWVRFDNAHAVDEKNRGYRRKRAAMTTGTARRRTTSAPTISRPLLSCSMTSGER